MGGILIECAMSDRRVANRRRYGCYHALPTKGMNDGGVMPIRELRCFVIGSIQFNTRSKFIFESVST